MRNSGDRTDNIGHTTKKYGLNQSHNGVSWQSPVSEAGSTSSLRGVDVIDAEFEHVDDLGHTIPSRESVNGPTDPGVRSMQIDFEDSESAEFRRLEMFAGKSPLLKRRRAFPVFGIAAVVAALFIGGFWFASGHFPVMMPADPQDVSSPTLAVLKPNSVVGVDSVVAQGAARNNPPADPAGLSIGKEPAGQRTVGSLIYVRAPKKQPITEDSSRIRFPVSPAARGHKDLAVSLAGGSGGR